MFKFRISEIGETMQQAGPDETKAHKQKVARTASSLRL